MDKALRRLRHREHVWRPQNRVADVLCGTQRTHDEHRELPAGARPEQQEEPGPE